MHEEILKMVADIVISFLGLGALYLLFIVKNWLNLRISEKRANYIDTIIWQFVYAAEQMFKDEDPTGEQRKDYVLHRLKNLGIVITDLINAKIESAVFDLNKNNFIFDLPIETEIKEAESEK